MLLWQGIICNQTVNASPGHLFYEIMVSRSANMLRVYKLRRDFSSSTVPSHCRGLLFLQL